MRPENVLRWPVSTRKRWVTAFALLAFFFQSLAVQTHIHAPVQELTAKAAALIVTAPSKAPLKTQDPVDQCRLCQELLHAGVFLAPLANTTPISLTFITAIFIALPGVTGTPAADFAWHSRAPPVR
jgi:hypothetical protein